MPPYRRKGYKRGYGRSRSTSRRRRPMGGSFMKRAKTRAFANLRTGGLLAIERKFSDFSFPATGMTNGGTGVTNGSVSTFSPPILGPSIYRSAVGNIYSTGVAPIALNVLGPGDTGSDRDGRQVINDSIHLRGQCFIGPTLNFEALACALIVNLVLVLDTQTNGGAPAGSAVFVNPGDYTGQGAQTGCSPFVNLSNSKRFRILKHIRRVISAPNAWYDGAHAHTQADFIWAMDVPLKGMKTNYVADSAVFNTNGDPGATSASIGDNGIFLFGWINGSANNANVAYNCRLRFRG